MSGDHNTTTGNVLIMCGAVYSYFNKYDIVASLVNDGDDCVIICERKYERLILNTLPSFFAELGFTMVVEKPVYVFERIEFCQAQPILTKDGTYRLVRSICKSMSKDSVSLFPFEGKGAQKWMSAVGQGGVALASGIPVVQEYYACLHRNARGATPLSHPTLVTGLFYCRQGMTGHYEDVTDETRLSFYLAFGVTPSEQLATEEYFRTLELTEGSLANRFAILPLANGGRTTV
nr:MAG: RNA-dependent RNA polymerase [Crogonang virus 82]